MRVCVVFIICLECIMENILPPDSGLNICMIIFVVGVVYVVVKNLPRIPSGIYVDHLDDYDGYDENV